MFFCKNIFLLGSRGFCWIKCAIGAFFLFGMTYAFATSNPIPTNIDPKFKLFYGGEIVSDSPVGVADKWLEQRKREVQGWGVNVSTCTSYIIDTSVSYGPEKVYAAVAAPNTPCAGGVWPMYDLSSYVCPQGYRFGWQPRPYCYTNYVLIVPHSAPPPYECAGNPIETSNGKKYQMEVDYASSGLGGVSMTRYYSNVNIPGEPLWHHLYNKNLTIINPSFPSGIKEKGLAYSEQSDACMYGWENLKSKISESWASGSVANFKNGECQILKGNTVVKILPVVSSEQLAMPGAVQLHRPDGSTIEYQNVDGDEYSSIGADRGILRRVNLEHVMWRYYSINGDIESYSNDGRLSSIVASNGIEQALIYDSATNLLVQVRDSIGGVLRFSYAGNLLKSVAANNQLISYVYNDLGLLTEKQLSDGSRRLYYYENSRFPSYLTGITDERGVRFATWIYDDQGRAVSSEHAGGAEKVLLTFNNDGSTSVTNPLGKSTIYRFADIAGARRVTSVEGQPTTSCVGANKNYTYTQKGWLASKTDWNGNKTIYQYNSKGQEISRTEADGSSVAKTISTEWHPTLNVKTKVTEPRRETTYTYDNNGLLINQSARSLP